MVTPAGAVKTATLASVTLKGAAVTVPTSVVPSKNSTFATVPSASVALALTVTFAGGRKMALLAGAVMLTVGGESTVITTGAEVVTAPLLSVARAVRL